MTVGNFTEVLGTDGFDSLRAEDLSVIYALGDRDHLNTSFSSPGENPTTILVGGSGNNNYIVWNDATAFILENSNSTNILWTTIGNSEGISLEDDNSFVAEIDNRHLYLGNTQSNQYAIVIDWQLPENKIETFSLSEGDLSYAEFVDSFRSSSNYRGNLTWAELNASGEIDLARLGLSADAIDNDFNTISARSLELSSSQSNDEDSSEEDLVTTEPPIEGDFSNSFDDESIYGDANDNVLQGGLGNDTIFGDAGNDSISGNFGDDLLAGGGNELDLDSLVSIGGSDTLSGSFGNDIYFVSLSAGGGSEIADGIDALDTDILLILAENTQFDLFFTVSVDDYDEVIGNSEVFGDSALSLSLPQAGVMGMEKSGNDLIIDLNHDGVAEAQNDLTVVDFFDDEGQLGNGGITQINQIIDSQAIVDFFDSEQPNSSENSGNSSNTVYRFFNNDTGVHFYTANPAERDAVEDLANYTFEGASYEGADPLTGNPVPVYRFLNQNTGVHLYTANEVERDAVEDLNNYTFEGEAFSAYESEIEGSIPIYRFYNSITGAHFYTPSEAERNNVEDNLTDFESEGIAYYALPIDSEVL